MNTTNYWSETCSAAVNQPLSSALDRLAASSFSGIAFFVASALHSLILLVAWLNTAANDRAKLWDQLSAFAGLAFSGICIGIVMLCAYFESHNGIVR